MNYILSTLCFLVASLTVLAQDTILIKNVNVWNGIDETPAHRTKKMNLVKPGAVNEMILAKKYKVNIAYGSDVFGPLGGEH